MKKTYLEKRCRGNNTSYKMAAAFATVRIGAIKWRRAAREVGRV